MQLQLDCSEDGFVGLSTAVHAPSRGPGIRVQDVKHQPVLSVLLMWRSTAILSNLLATCTF